MRFTLSFSVPPWILVTVWFKVGWNSLEAEEGWWGYLLFLLSWKFKMAVFERLLLEIRPFCTSMIMGGRVDFLRICWCTRGYAMVNLTEELRECWPTVSVADATWLQLLSAAIYVDVLPTCSTQSAELSCIYVVCYRMLAYVLLGPPCRSTRQRFKRCHSETCSRSHFMIVSLKFVDPKFLVPQDAGWKCCFFQKTNENHSSRF